MRNYKTQAIILKRKNFGEADRIVTAFTEQEGKIKIKAAGVRRITSRRSPHIELLNLSLLTLYRGKKFPILTEAETLNSFSLIKNNLRKISLAYYICEITDKLCPEGQENFRIFSLLKDTLLKLSFENNFKKIISEFEIELLSTLGFYPALKKFHPVNFDSIAFIEGIIERRLKTREFMLSLH